LIIWNHNQVYRRTRRTHAQGYAKEAAAPDLRCLSWTHDRDFAAAATAAGKSLPSAAVERWAAARGPEARQGVTPWCPPAAACYDSMGSVRELAAAADDLYDRALDEARVIAS
jgi:hypothetical protein